MNSSVQLGVKAFQEKRFAEAITLFEATIQARPDDFPARLMLAKAYQANSQFREARMVLQQLLRETDQPNLVQLAQQGLAGLPPEEEVEAPVEEPPLFCPKCGELVPEERREEPWCSCGWNKPVFKRRLLLTDLQSYAEKAGAILAIKKGTDLYTIDQDEMRIMHLSDQSSPVDPRLVLKVERGLAFILPEELSLVMPQVHDSALFRERKQKNDLSLGKLLDWDELVVKIRDTLGYDPTQRPLLFTLDEVFLLYRVLPKEIIDTAVEESVRTNLTVGQSFLEIGGCSLRELLVGAIGGPRLFLPANHLANQLGFLLFEQGKLPREAFESALRTQVQRLKPLANVLTEQKIVAPEALQSAQRELREVRIHLAETERIGELLIRRGAITRTELIQALDEQKRKRRPLGKLLLELGSLKNEELLTDALHWQELKIKTRRQGRFRLGEILVEQNVITREALAEALVRQIDHPLSLGELLVQARVCTPEQLIDGLLAQEDRLNAYVESLIEKEIRARKEGREMDAQRKKARSDRDRVKREQARAKAREHEQAERLRKALQSFFSLKSKTSLTWVALLALVGFGLSQGASFFLKEKPSSKANPAVAASGVSGVSGTPTRTLGQHPTYQVDIDAVMSDLEAGKANPLEGHTKPILPVSTAQTLDQAARQLGKSQASMPIIPADQAVPPTTGTLLPDAQLTRSLAQDQALAKRSTDDPAPCIRMGDTLSAQGKPKEAIESYQSAIKRDPNSATAYQQLGLALERQGKPEEARAKLEKASQLAPLNPTVQLNYANHLQAEGKHEKALAVYQQAAAADPKDPRIYTRLGISLRAKGDEEGAIASFKRARELAPKDPYPSFQAATTFEARGDLKKAEVEYARAVKLLDTTATEKVRKGRLALKQKNHRAVLAHLQEAIQCRGMRANALLSLGKARLARQDFQGASPFFQAAKATFRSNAPLHQDLGVATLALRQAEEAANEFLAATKIDPKYAPPYYYLGFLSQQQEKSDAARRFFSRFLTLRSSGAQAQDARQRLRTLQ